MTVSLPAGQYMIGIHGDVWKPKPELVHKPIEELKWPVDYVLVAELPVVEIKVPSK